MSAREPKMLPQGGRHVRLDNGKPRLAPKVFEGLADSIGPFSSFSHSRASASSFWRKMPVGRLPRVGGQTKARANLLPSAGSSGLRKTAGPNTLLWTVMPRADAC